MHFPVFRTVFRTSGFVYTHGASIIENCEIGRHRPSNGIQGILLRLATLGGLIDTLVLVHGEHLFLLSSFI